MVSPVTVKEVAVPGPVAIILPGLDVTVYPVIGEPPVDAGAVKLTVACASPAVAVPMVGAPGGTGAATGVTVFEGDEAGPVPIELVAFTVKV